MGDGEEGEGGKQGRCTSATRRCVYRFGKGVVIVPYEFVGSGGRTRRGDVGRARRAGETRG